MTAAQKLKSSITSKTSVSIALVISVIAVGGAPLASILFRINEAEARITKLEVVGTHLESHQKEDADFQMKLYDTMRDIDSRLSNIEGSLDIKRRK